MQSIGAFLNKVIKGNCVTVLNRIPDQSVDFVLTDPPYVMNYITRDGRRCLSQEHERWLIPAYEHLFRVLKPDRFCVSFYGWPWIDRFMAAWKQCGFRPVSHLVWIKSYCSREGYTRSHHEVAYLLAKGHPSKPARPLEDVLDWEYTNNIHHPTEKPV